MSNYILMDSRAFTNPDDAGIYAVADSLEEALELSKLYGDYQKFEVAITDSKCKVCWELYANINNLKK